MKTRNEIEIRQLNGAKTEIGNKPLVIVENVWNAKKLVSITVNGQQAEVLAEELIRAIENSIDVID